MFLNDTPTTAIYTLSLHDALPISTADITARALTISATGVNKIYDATTAASVTLSDNRVSGDVFTDSNTTATFANKNRSEEHTSELQSHSDLVCRLLLEKKKKKTET